MLDELLNDSWLILVRRGEPRAPERTVGGILIRVVSLRCVIGTGPKECVGSGLASLGIMQVAARVRAASSLGGIKMSNTNDNLWEYVKNWVYEPLSRTIIDIRYP